MAGAEAAGRFDWGVVALWGLLLLLLHLPPCRAKFTIDVVVDVFVVVVAVAAAAVIVCFVLVLFFFCSNIARHSAQCSLMRTDRRQQQKQQQ